MEAPHLWLIDRDGRSFIVNLRDNSWNEVSTPELKSRNCFKRISAVSSCAWAINANQQPCLYVHSTQVSIRARVDTWENERWGLMNGWSVKSMFSSDRSHFSSKNGKENLPKSDFKLPSMYWTWESDWFIDRKVPGDIEGWQYAIDFPRTYYPEKSNLSCVRRRCWARYHNFDGYDQWLLIPGLSDDPIKQPFQDIAVGGTMIPGHKPGQLSVWAITFHGQVVFRAGITDKNPEGDKWVHVPPPSVTITQISVSRTGVLWGVSWEGIAVVRIGVNYDQPSGMQWVEVRPPHLSPNNEICQLLQVSVGVNGVWALTKDSQVWFRKGVNTSQMNASQKDITGTSWIQMVGRFLLLSVGPNDQVFGLSTCGDHIYFRTDVKPDEMCGRQWRALRTGRSLSGVHGSRLKRSSNIEDSDEGASRSHENTSLPRYVEFLTWINSGACDVDATFFNDNHRGLLSAFSSMSISTLDDRDASWRNEILQRLRSRNQQQVNVFRSYDEAISQGTWSKKARCQILLDSQFNLWSDSVIKLNQERKDNNGDVICYYEKTSPYLSYGEIRIPFTEITCVSIIHKMARHNCMAVFAPSRTQEQNPLLISFPNEKELNDWLTNLSSASMQARGIQGPVSPKALWATSSCGDVFVSETRGVGDCAHSQRFWRQIGGHLSVVQAGTGGVVWGIGFDGNPYVYTGGYGGGVFTGFSSSSYGIHTQEDYDVHFIYENQRWNPIEGFSDRRLPSDRYVWSDKSGVYERTKEGFLLPSSQWQWLGQWQVDTRPGITDKQGWQYAVDFPRHYHAEKNWNDYVRRRRWRRRCKLTTTGPWLLITPTVKLRDVSIQIDEVTSDEEMSVWVVGSQGDVLYRHGVTKTCPQGHSWEHIIADVPFLSISVGGQGRVWGVAEDGTTYFRAGFADNITTGSCWFHIADRPPYLVQISAGASSVWARDKEGTLWYRVNITEAYPEGTEWIEQQGHASHLSTGPNNQLYVCHEGAIKSRTNITADYPVGSRWEVTLCDHWWTVCARSDFQAQDKSIAKTQADDYPEVIEKGEDVVSELTNKGTTEPISLPRGIKSAGSMNMPFYREVSGIEEKTGAMSLQMSLDLSNVDIYTQFNTGDKTFKDDDEDSDNDDNAVLV